MTVTDSESMHAFRKGIGRWRGGFPHGGGDLLLLHQQNPRKNLTLITPAPA